MLNTSAADELMLPARVEEINSHTGRIQALRIDVMHCLHKQGGWAYLQDMGQDPKINTHKKAINFVKDFSLLSLLKALPNFNVDQTEPDKISIELIDYSVEDDSAVVEYVKEHAKGGGRGADGKGKGKMKGFS